MLEKEINTNKKVLLIKTTYDFMPLGKGYVMSMLEKNNIGFDFWDMLRPQEEERFYLDNLKNDEYALVATGGFVFNLNDFIEVSRKCKKANSSVPILLGGNITRNIRPEKLFKYINVDYIYIGEAEASFVEFLKSFYKGKTIESIPGISFIDKRTNQLVRNRQDRVNLANIDVMPAYHRFDVEYYISTNKHIRFQKLGKTFPMLTGRGCTGGCSFCSPTVGKFIAPSIINTMKEIEFLIKNYDFDAFHFITEIFFEFPQDVLNFCEEYKRNKFNKKWFCCVSPHMTPDVYPVMKDAGCVGFNMGLESGSDRILAKTKIGCTVKNFEKLYREAKKNNLFVDVSYMVANHNETVEDMRATFDTLINNRMQQESFGITTAYPGTSIYAKAYKQGKINDEFAYLKHVLSSRYWRTYNINEFDYLNISAIPDEKLIPTIMSETRRYYSHLRNTFQAKNQIIKDKSGKKLSNAHDLLGSKKKYFFHGNCVDCNKKVIKEIDPKFTDGMIELTEVCDNCFTRNFFDISILKDFKIHFKNLKKRIDNSKNIILIGRNKFCEDFLFFNYLNIDISKVKLLIDERSAEEEKNGIEEYSGSKKKFFFGLNRYNRDYAKICNFDLALIGDLIPEQLNAFLPESKVKDIEFLDPYRSPSMVEGLVVKNIYQENYSKFLSKSNMLLEKSKKYINPDILRMLKKIRRIRISN